jgi:aspartyl-tRNA(Asn)/glutamyl-tRNA(Gln) amidotransferase subunit B
VGYIPAIGFEVHAQLSTRSKIFCDSANESGGEPNTRVCSVCLGMPGVLPVLNREAVRLGMRVALALGASIAERTGFARKNYFYPDLPKGYQITQHEHPLARGGYLDIDVEGTARRVGIRQIHLEEDAGKSLHGPAGGTGASLVDMNRCGVPLVEIVTLPDIQSVDEADAFLTELRRILVFIGVTSGDMHEGSLRFDTNVSVRSLEAEPLGTATEIKNLNSFRAVRKALEHEIARQTALLRSGGEVRHETLLWDDVARRVAPMRSKEVASDYRYFPEPDLGDIAIESEWIEEVRGAMPELPAAVRARLVDRYGLPAYDAAVLTSDPDTALYFELTVLELLHLLVPGAATAALPSEPFDVAVGDRQSPGEARLPEGAEDVSDTARKVSSWVMTVVGGYVNAKGIDVATLGRERVPPARLAAILMEERRGAISESGAKKVFEAAAESEEEIGFLIERLNLTQVSGEEDIESVVREVIAGFPEEVARYRAGERKLFGYLMGQIMRATHDRANPRVASEILGRLLRMD